ncbi:hypothetical protein [Oceanobacillus sp. MO10714A]|uniref:hypothetical protein n=1 Tax=Oceanobacillus sp. MO10714A TaxID=3098290 RepID=UPI00300E1C45
MNNGDLEEFPEFDTKAEYIDLDAYQGVVETDNKGNRIILFEDEKGHSEYKSIFIKHNNRLKIVQFKGDGLLYNGRDYKIITSAKKVEGNELGNHHLFYKRRISGGFLLF